MSELTDQNFEKEIQNAKIPVLVDFFASWCAPCFVLTPILEKLAKDLEGKIFLTKANLDDIPLAAQKFEIDRIPTVILFKNGKPVGGFIGLRPEIVIREWLENMLKENLSTDIEKILKEYEDYANKNGFKLNQNSEVLKRIVKGLLENEKKYGKRYCPCRRVSGHLEEDQKNICPCIYHLQELEKNGQCLCGLFQVQRE